MSASIQVAIKVRPLIKREEDDNLPIQWTVQDKYIAPLDAELKKRGEGGFCFDHIFDMNTTTYDVFSTIAKPIIEAAVNGFNGTIFAYGQTSSGKTYTMMGTRDAPGVIPLSIVNIFDLIHNSDRQFLLRVSYIEIYNERVNDLLNADGTDLKIKEDPKTGQAYVKCKEELVNCPENVLAIMKKGDKNRRIGETNMNERSSRSHTILRITIESREASADETGAIQVSQLNLVDLAGSERSGQTGAIGTRFKEGTHINMSLSALGLVIMQLSESQDNPKMFVNFRDSKLTRILQCSLGGNAMTTIICAVTPAALEETQCTLAFASRAKRIKNKPKLNEELSEATLLKRYAKHITKLETELNKVKSTKVVEMESKLLETERANQILEERIELLKKSILCGNSSPQKEEVFQSEVKRRRTWGGSGTLLSKNPMFHNAVGLPTIIELEKTPEKKEHFKEHSKRRQSIIQQIDIAHETFQTAFTDFELELIECERARDDGRLSNGSSGGDDDFFITKRPQRTVTFMDDVSVFNTSRQSLEITVEPKSPEECKDEPDTPKIALRRRINFLMENYNSLCEENGNLKEFTKLERQIIVDDEVEKAMAKHNEKLAASEQMFNELNEKYTKLQIHSAENDKFLAKSNDRLAELERQMAESTNSLSALRREKQALVDKLNKIKGENSKIESSPSNKEETETSSIFEHASYFEEMNVSDVQADSMFINDTQNTQDLTMYDSSLANIAANTTVTSDVREVKLLTEKLKETVQLLTTENADLTKKLDNEKDRANQMEKNLQDTIAELLSKIHTITEEKNMLRNSVSEFEQRLQKSDETARTNAIDDETMKSIENYKATIAKLTSENIELSSNLMNKIEELDRVKDLKSPPGDHDCAYRELSVNLSERNKLLENENIELSNNLMEKIEEYDRLKEDLETLNCRLSSSSSQANSNNLVEISMNNSKLIETKKSDHESVKTVDDLLRLSIGGNDSTCASIEKQRSNGDVVNDLLLLSIVENGSICDSNKNVHAADELAVEKGETVNGSAIGHPTIGEILQISIVPNGTTRESMSNDNLSTENGDTWKNKAEMPAEQVKDLQLLNDKLKSLKLTSCKQCAYLTDLNENRKALKVEAKEMNRKLEKLQEKLQEKFDRECAESEILRTKANEDLNLSVCDSTMNESMMFDGTFSVSILEDKVERMRHELENLKEKFDKLSNDYNDKCDEIEKLQDASSRETTPTPSSTDSPRPKRSDAKLEKLEIQMENLKTDFRRLKKGVNGISAAQQKFFNAKAITRNEIDSVKLEKSELEDKFTETEDSSMAEERMKALENEVARLTVEIESSNIVKEELQKAKLSLEAEVQSLKTAKESLEEKSMETKDLSIAVEKIEQLELKMARLTEEIESSNIVKEELQKANLSLEAEVQSLKTAKESLEEKSMGTEDLSIAEEKIKQLELKVARLKDQIDSSEIAQQELGNAKLLFEAEVRSLKATKDSLEKQFAKIEDSSLVEEKMKQLKLEVARLKDQIDSSEIAQQELGNAKLLLEAEVRSLKATKDSLEKQFAKIEDSSLVEEKMKQLELEVVRLKDQIDSSEIAKQELQNAKSSLKAEFEFLTAQKSVIEEGSTKLSNSLRNLEENNSTLKLELEKVISENNELINNRLIKTLEIVDSPNNNVDDYEKTVESLKLKLKEATDDSTKYIEKNVELTDRLTKIAAAEVQLDDVKEQLKNVTETLNKFVTENAALKDKLMEFKALEEVLSNSTKLLPDNEVTSLKDEITKLKSNLNTLNNTLRELEETNSSLTTELETLKLEKEDKTIAEFPTNSPYETLKEYETMIDELKTKLQDITNNLHANAKETLELNDQLSKLSTAKEEFNDIRISLESEVTNLKSERADIEETLSTLRQSLDQLEEKNSSLSTELEKMKAEKEQIVASQINSCEIVEKSDLLENEKTIEELNTRVHDITAKLKRYVAENDELNTKVSELEDTLRNKPENLDETNSSKMDEKLREEVDSARECITKELKSMKPTSECQDLTVKSVSELFGVFVREIMSKEEEIIKMLTVNFERQTRKLEESKRQSVDAEKRANVWAKELEAEIERTQQDLTRQESKKAELTTEISKLNNLLMESNHENQMLIEKMKVLELDFNTLQAELETRSGSKQNATLNTTQQDRERLIEEALETREMELSSKLRNAEKHYKEKLEELTNNLESYKMKNIELTNNLEGLEINERQLRNIVDMKSNDLVKCNNAIERIQSELKNLTEKHNRLSLDHAEKSQQCDEITTLLKNKCDKLSEYKTKLETITPEYEHLKDQAVERQVRLEKYKSEIECITTENEKQTASLKDKLDSEEIKSAGYRKQLADLTNRNTMVLSELEELRTKCDELERSNGKLTKSLRNSTSKIRAEEEMEDLRDSNRTLQRNLDGAANRITELQEMKTQMMKELFEVRGSYEIVCNENAEMQNTLASHRSGANDAIELRGKYELLLQEKNRVALELEDKKSMLAQLERKLESCVREREELKSANKELDEEMEDMVEKINELTKENAELDDKMHLMNTKTNDTDQQKIKELAVETQRLRSQVEKYESEIEGLSLHRDCLRSEFEAASKTSEILKNENGELRVKIAHLDRADSLSCDSSRSESPALDLAAARVDHRRRRSRTELFNQKRQLEVFEDDGKFPWGEGCRCVAMEKKVRELEHDLVSKNGEVAALEIRIQSENFPYMKKAKDLEELLGCSRRKMKALEAEVVRLRELKIIEMSSECNRCKHWNANKRDQSSQCMPDCSKIRFSGMSSGFVEDHMKMEKLEKIIETLKSLCRQRQRNILELEKKVKELEKELNKRNQHEDEKSETSTASARSTNSKLDSARAMKENVPMARGVQRPPIHLRRDWFNQ